MAFGPQRSTYRAPGRDGYWGPDGAVPWSDRYGCVSDKPTVVFWHPFTVRLAGSTCLAGNGHPIWIFLRVSERTLYRVSCRSIWRLERVDQAFHASLPSLVGGIYPLEVYLPPGLCC